MFRLLTGLDETLTGLDKLNNWVTKNIFWLFLVLAIIGVVALVLAFKNKKTRYRRRSY